MNQLVVLKDHHKKVLVSCPLGFWDTVAYHLGWLLLTCLRGYFPFLKCQGKFGNPVFPPRHMSLLKMVVLMFQQFPIVRTRKVHRTVTICIKHHLVRVDIMAAAWIYDTDILYILAYHELIGSSELNKLPCWMRREIHKRARHAGFVTTTMLFEEVRASKFKNISWEGIIVRSDRLASDARIVSVSRCSYWKGGAIYARKITAWDAALGIVKNIRLISSMHPVCYEIVVSADSRSHWLSRPIIFLLATLERRYPCFFYTTVGSRIISVIYGSVGLYSILLSIQKDISFLAWQAYGFWQGNMVLITLEQSLLDLRLGYIQGLLPNFSAAPIAPSRESLQIEDTARESTETSEGTGDTKDTSNGTAPTDEEVPTPEPSGKEVHDSEPVGKDVPVTAPTDEEAPGPEPTDKGTSDSDSIEKDSPDSAPTGKEAPAEAPTGKDVPAEVPIGKKAPDSDPVGKEVPDPVPTDKRTLDPALLEALAASYVKVTGAKEAPRIVLNAADLDNTKKSSKYRRINRYDGNTPALSIEAMMEVFDVMYPGYYITDFVRATDKEGKDIIFLHTNSSEITCPCCGKTIKKVKDANTRTIQDISLRNGIGVQIELTVGRFSCDNPECTGKGITGNELCTFAAPYKRHTTRVEYLALAIGISSSFHDTERQMKLMGLQYGDDCVKNLLASLEFSDEKYVRIIGMDDVSIRKGQSYCTIIYNMENGHMLKLIEGRGGIEFEKELESWLDEHPDIEIICRDRARSYGCIIDRYCRKRKRKIQQVADRFHLLQNLSDHLRDSYYQDIPYRIALRVGEDGAVILDKMPKMLATPVGEKPEGLADWHYDNSAPVDDMGMPVFLDICVDRVSEKEKAAKVESKTLMFELFNNAREDYAALQRGFVWGEKKKFAIEHGISVYQLQKYVMEMEQEDFDREYEKAKGWNPASRPKLFDDYKNLAYKMLKDGHSIMTVYWYIKEVAGGWKLADSTLVDYIMETYKVACPDEPLPLKEELIRMDYPDNEMVIGRQRLFYALMTLDEKKIDQDLAPHLDLICKTYPVCETIRTVFREFHDIIIVDKEMNKRTPEKCKKALQDLDVFIDKHQDDDLKGFASSLRSDIKCVSNAITMRYSSGGVEGRNCKYKEYLRRFYGHVPVETLEQKLKLGFMYTGKDFSIAQVAPWLVPGLPV